jgi:hypothetical protein
MISNKAQYFLREGVVVDRVVAPSWLRFSWAYCSAF